MCASVATKLKEVSLQLMTEIMIQTLLVLATAEQSRVWVATSVAESALPNVEPRGIYRDLALGLARPSELNQKENAAVLLSADPAASLFVVETHGPDQLKRVQQNNVTGLKVVGTFGLSVVVAATVWPEVDFTLASSIVPVRRVPLHTSSAHVQACLLGADRQPPALVYR